MGAPEPFDQFIPRLPEFFEQHRDPVRAAAMSAYMRNQFPFMGIPSPKQKELTRRALSGLAKPTLAELTEVSRVLWEMDEREYQYAAVMLLVSNVRVCDTYFLPHVRELLTTTSWWDTVTYAATRLNGPREAVGQTRRDTKSIHYGTAT